MTTMTTTTSHAANPGFARVMLFRLMAFMCIALYSKAWIYPSREFGEAVTVEGGPAFVMLRYILWLLVVLTAASHLVSRGPGLKNLFVFTPFLLIGLVSGLVGFDPVLSIRMLIFWCVMAVSATLLGFEMSEKQAMGVLLWSFLLILFASLVLLAVVPQMAVQQYEGRIVVRGLYYGKNQFGWVAALALILLVGLRKNLWWPVFLGGAGLAFLCLLVSASKGSLVAAMGAVGYGVILNFTQRSKIPPLPAFVLSVVLLITAGLGASLGIDMVMEALGRDATMTGRTVIWSRYLDEMTDYLFLGQGPGAYTSISPFTTKVARQLVEHGQIYTPHNMYIAMLGETGIIGVAIYIFMLFYYSFIFPLRNRSVARTLVGMLGFLIMIEGMKETHEIYDIGVGMFTLLFMRAVALRSENGWRRGGGERPVYPWLASTRQGGLT